MVNGVETIMDPLGIMDEARMQIRKELREDRFWFPERFEGSQPCICGKPLLLGEKITRMNYCYRWIHLECADRDRSDDKPQSRAFSLMQRLAQQAKEREAIWRGDLIELARLVFLGEWGVDYWVEDQMLATHIINSFGLYTLTRGERFSTDKGRQKYAQKIEKEVAKRKGWICRRCRRLIWVEKSVNIGMGPICLKHLPKASQDYLLKGEEPEKRSDEATERNSGMPMTGKDKLKETGA
jgi:hypothetical protein